MYEVRVRCGFRAEHALRLPTGEMEPVHPHDWSVEAVFEGAQLDGRGLLIDFTLVQEQLNKITVLLGGSNLNLHPLLAGLPPSAELLARAIFEELDRLDWHDGRLRQVVVHEASGCSASFKRETSAAATSSGS